MGLPFVRSNGVCQGGANVVLTCPHRLEKIRGDGNCLFRSFSHMPSIEPYIQGSGIRSVAEYIRTSNMEKAGTWGTDIEILTLVHLLNTPVYAYMDDITL